MNQLRFRLTDRLAHARMDERGVPHSGTKQKFMPLRMQCRFVTLDGVDFTSHRGAARAALLDVDSVKQRGRPDILSVAAHRCVRQASGDDASAQPAAA